MLRRAFALLDNTRMFRAVVLLLLCSALYLTHEARQTAAAAYELASRTQGVASDAKHYAVRAAETSDKLHDDVRDLVLSCSRPRP